MAENAPPPALSLPQEVASLLPPLSGATFEAKVFANGAREINVLDVRKRWNEVMGAGAGAAYPELAAALNWIPHESDPLVRKLGIGVEAETGRSPYLAVQIDPASSWKIAETVAFRLDSAEVLVTRPREPLRPKVLVEVGGTIGIGAGAGVSFLLTNMRSERNPYGRWLLMPAEPAIPVLRVLNWIAADGSLAQAMPAWGRSILEKTSFVRLALGFDLEQPSITSLEGGLEWKDKIPIPGLSNATIDDLSVGLEVTRPFDGDQGQRRVRFDFAGQATLASAVFRLSGWAGTGGWGLTASCDGSLSLTQGLQSLAVVATGAAADLFGDLSVSLKGPELLLGSTGFSFKSQVTIDKRSGASFCLADGELTFQPGLIQVERRGQRTAFQLRAGISIRWKGGPQLEEASLLVKQDEDGTLVEARAAMAFPPARGERAPTRLEARAEYLRSERGSGFQLQGEARDVSLRAIADGLLKLFGQALPDDFPRLTASELKLAFNTATGEFALTGKTASGAFKIGETEFKDATFDFVIERQKKGVEQDARLETTVKLSGGATIGELRFKLELGVAGAGLFIEAGVEGQVNLGQFVRAVIPGVSVADDALQLTQVGLRYGDQRFTFYAEWPGEGDIYFIAGGQDGPLFLLRPGKSLPYLSNVEISWARAESQDSALKKDKKYTFRKGLRAAARLDLKGTRVAELLQVNQPFELAFEDDKLRVGPPQRALGAPADPPAPDKQPGTTELAAAGATQPAPGDPNTKWYPGPYSLGTLIDKISKPKEGQPKPRWREYLGNGLRVERVGVTPYKKPMALRVEADAAITVGPWVSVAARSATLLLQTRPGFSLKNPTAVAADFTLSGVALSVTAQPWIKLNAAATLDRYQREPGATDWTQLGALVPADPGRPATPAGATESRLVIQGLGQLELLQKLSIGMLARLVLERPDPTAGYRLTEGFGFVYATGLMVGSPPIILTGIAGGFGYNCVVKVPARPEDVPEFPLIALMQGRDSDKDSGGADALALLGKLEKFKGVLQSRQGAYSIAFGVTLQIAQLVDCAALLMVQLLNPGFEVGLLGVADLQLRLNRQDPASKLLGHIQLGLSARFSSTEGTLKILGALTSKSWILDPKCQVRGGFALCVWFDGPYKGDFLVSLGGYSPLVPVKPHYPALDRVGVTYKPDDNTLISGEMYLALDRYGIQFGWDARLKFITETLRVYAQYTVDVLIQWAPVFLLGQLCISVEVEVRTFVTLRLALAVDMSLWGPPFGARVTIKIDLLFTSLKLAADIGAPRPLQQPAATIQEVLALARGKRSRLLEVATSASLDGKRRAGGPLRLRADDLRLDVALSVPVTRVYAAGTERADLAQKDPLDIRPMRLNHIGSDLTYKVCQDDGAAQAGPALAGLGDWRLTPEITAPTEALWYFPGDATEQQRRLLSTPSGRKAITQLRIEPPRPTYGPRQQVSLEADAVLPVVKLGAASAGEASPPADLLGAIPAALFDLGGCAPHGNLPKAA